MGNSGKPRGRPLKERKEELLIHRVVTDLDDALADLLNSEIDERGKKKSALVRQYIIDGLRQAGHDIPLTEEEKD